MYCDRADRPRRQTENQAQTDTDIGQALACQDVRKLLDLQCAQMPEPDCQDRKDIENPMSEATRRQHADMPR